MLAVVLAVAASGAESFAPARLPGSPNAAMRIRMNEAPAQPAPEPKPDVALKLGKTTEGENTLVVQLPGGTGQEGFQDLADLMADMGFSAKGKRKDMPDAFASMALPLLALGVSLLGAAGVAWRRPTTPRSPAEMELTPAAFLVEEAPAVQTSS